MNWDLVEHSKRLMTNFGAAWVMWLLLALSVVSVAIMLERGWFYYSLRDDLVALARSLGDYLRRGEVAQARRLLENSPSAEAAVVVAGLVEAERGPQAAEEAMAGAAALQRMKLEKRLAYLGTLGNNAPFVGLLGTVIGIVQAFDELGKAAKMQTQQTASTIAPQTVMTSIAEALVATAIGLLVAIPAVAAYNTFQRLTKSTLANTEVLSRILLAHLKAEPLHEENGLMAGGSQQDVDEGIVGINVTPLVDITLVLLIIFMVVAKMVVSQSVPLDLPKAASGTDLQVVFAVELYSNGDITVDQKKLTNDDALLPLAREGHAKSADLRAVIKADGTVQHQRVIHVLDLLKQAGISKIAFGVTPIAPEPVPAPAAAPAAAPAPR